MVTYINKVRVKLQGRHGRSYDILLGSGLFDRLVKDLRRKEPDSRYAIITDSNVHDLYALSLKKSLGQAADLITFKAGEKSKTRRVKERIEDRMLELKHGRDSCVIALGGGVVGDIAGYVAATYMRGIPYIQIPTTLLAMADSSIGGKTAVDVPAGKNMIGAFHQPTRVYADLDTLSTLPKSHIKSGLVEVIKHGIIRDPKLFRLLEKERARVLSLDNSTLGQALKLSMEVKAAVVSQDETESDLRMILNFGHTIGHSLERLSRYRLLHGNAVAMGMLAEAGIAKRMKLLSDAGFDSIAGILKSYGYSMKHLKRWTPVQIMDAAAGDKKSRGGEIRFTLPASIGKMAKKGSSHGIKVPRKLALKALSEVA